VADEERKKKNSPKSRKFEKNVARSTDKSSDQAKIVAAVKNIWLLRVLACGFSGGSMRWSHGVGDSIIRVSMGDVDTSGVSNTVTLFRSIIHGRSW
jgi:hypothetical protein